MYSVQAIQRLPRTLPTYLPTYLPPTDGGVRDRQMMLQHKHNFCEEFEFSWM
jgi:hypothetical protein